jgi:hypothetical protein
VDGQRTGNVGDEHAVFEEAQRWFAAAGSRCGGIAVAEQSIANRTEVPNDAVAAGSETTDATLDRFDHAVVAQSLQRPAADAGSSIGGGVIEKVELPEVGGSQ